MSTGGYDAPHLQSHFSRLEPRRFSAGVSVNYERPMNAEVRRRSPSPGPSRRQYDTYFPHRSDSTAFRGGAANDYRSNNYRPEYNSSYYSRSPSPDPYGPPLRGTDSSSWDRGSSWRPPVLETANTWPERKPLPPSPTTSITRGRGPRDDASTRMLEPSELWKQTQFDRSGRVDHTPPPDRYFERRGRDSLNSSPDRLSRNERASGFIPGGERYRPVPAKREAHPVVRSDSYRPQHNMERANAARRDPISPSSSHFRRGSGTVAHSRISDRHESPIPRKAPMSVTSLVSPAVLSPSLVSSDPPWPSSSPSALDAARREPPTRQSSRSSIASTHVSDRGSPAIASIPQPSISLHVPLPPKPVTPLVSSPPEQSKDKPEPQKLELKREENDGILPISLKTETKDVPCPVPSPVKESTADISPNSIARSCTKEDVGIKDSPPAKVQAPTAASHVVNNGISLPQASQETPTLSKSPATSKPIPSPPVTQASLVTQETTPDVNHKSLEIKQPKPVAASKRLTTAKDVLDLNIPPTTHSPSLSPDPSAAGPGSNPLFAHSNLPRPHEIPPIKEAKTKEEAVRIVIMTRMVRDYQSREARIIPVLNANLSIAPPPEVHPTATPESLIDKMFNGQSLQARLDSAVATRPLLTMYFEKRKAMIDGKVARLRDEYLARHEHWVAHCNSLDDQQKSMTTEQENQYTGRTTRRSTAITDAVRSDFEMEQIIATLGNEDAMDPNHLSMRNLAKVPDMISAVNGKVDYVFDDTAHLVDNPAEYFGPQTGIDDWTEDEKQIFIEKFGAFPKQFGLIADSLPNKTAAQCVDYYYLHKKRFIDFRRIVSQYAPNKRKRRGMGRKKGNGLLADIAIHDMEVNRGSGAGSPSTIATTRAPRGRKTLIKETSTAAKTAPSSRRNAILQLENTPTSTPTPEPESRPKRRKVVPSVAATPAPSSSTVVPSAAATPILFASTPNATPTPSIAIEPSISELSAVTPIQKIFSIATSVEEEATAEAESRPVKRAKRTRKIKSAVMVADEPPSPPLQTDKPLPSTSINDMFREAVRPIAKHKVTGPPSAQWSEEDKKLFLSLVAQFGDDFKRIASSMPFKTTVQVSNYYKSTLAELNLAEISARAPKRSPTPGQAWTLTHPSGFASAKTKSTATGNKGTGPAPPPMSSLLYDPSKNLYPATSAMFGNHASSREAVHPPWTSPPLPTRMNQRQAYPFPTSPTSTHTSSEGHRHPPYNPPSRTAPNPYPYRGAPEAYGPSTGSRPPPLPGRHTHSSSGPDTHTRPRASSTSMYPSSPTLSPSMPSNSRASSGYTSAAAPAPAPSAAIVHSPTIPSPKLPVQTSYGRGQSYSTPGPHNILDSYGSQYPAKTPTRTAWGPPSQQRFGNLDSVQSNAVGLVPYGTRSRGASVSSGDGRDGRRDDPYISPFMPSVTLPGSRPPPPSANSSNGSASRTFWGWS